ncbi:MAG: cation:proton antiporter [Candidatus Marinimicrobia bacterium]|nr:cation:proton antiporter [Candidatus Neomarinimicrobiota bacterium]
MKRSTRHILPALFIILLIPQFSFASDGNSMVEQMMLLVFQLALILFAAKYMGKLFDHFHLPSVIGELFAGILIGPFLLGKIPLPGLPHGLFGDFLFNNPTAALPVSNELYAFSVIASILLLFMVGLETDINLFLRYSFPSIVIGGMGVVFSFVAGTGIAAFFLKEPFMHPQALFLGVISTATSVGITARILSSRKKINSPEGVTILGSAVIDDVFGIILLAIVIGIAASKLGMMNWAHIGRTSIKALSVWLIFTVLGLVFAQQISRYLKTFKKASSIGIMSFGLALLFAGIFESAGLAMIIGAYVMGLSLSKTDLSYVIQESLHNIYEFFVPIFFCISGMFVDFSVFNNWKILLFGIVYAVTAYVTKMLGCGIPARFFKFNNTGAIRIGIGMVPRGEVALIIIGIGLSHGILNEELTGVAILMVLVTSVMAPVQLDHLLKKKKSGVAKGLMVDEQIQTDYSFPSTAITELISNKLISYFQNEGFFINIIEGDNHIYHIRRLNTFLTFQFLDTMISFSTREDDIPYVKNIMYETLLDLNQTIEKLKAVVKPEELKKDLKMKTSSGNGKTNFPLDKVLDAKCIIMNLDADSKEGIIRSLVDVLNNNNSLLDAEEVKQAVLERENAMSTGMQHGVALPHGKTDAVKKITMAVGLKPEGFDFKSLDGKPSKVFILVVSRKKTAEPHIQLLSEIGKKLFSENAVNKLLSCKNEEEVRNFFVK